MDSIEPMYIRLTTSSEIVLDSMLMFLIVICDIVGHASTQHVPCWIVNNLQQNIILGMDWKNLPIPSLIGWLALWN